MPELPEVESLRRILERSLVGRTIVRARVAEKRLRRTVAADFASRVALHRIVRLSRRAKYLIIELESTHAGDGAAMIVHLGMSGSLTHRQNGFNAADFDPRHDHVEFQLDDRSRLVYNDPRRFGLIRLVEADALATTVELQQLGPEPLSADFNADYLARVARGRRTAIKNVIMDQAVVAGIGNIYASEILFRAGIRPTRRAERVTRREIERIVAATAPILRAAIGNRGTTFRSYRDSRGRPGRFAERLMVYGREGKPCLVCGSPIRAIVVGQRASFYCPHCQR
ncbi:MAG TPA: bifunctional DNA-formamidopyrimidine glycosylase/DNA-(apurinic or apyrimidinic site) lyase [Candidatus Binataceae bacterium]|nr:bifunctional DNA-formamidopyrimidine glycosylase/DNA-(apurinic or apyrimidinic site) lyase [Candidatus Binataceae bacterium]